MTGTLVVLLLATASLADALPDNPYLEAVPASTEKVSSFVQKVLDLTNQERTKRGLRPLALQTELANSASWHAKDLSKRDTLSHSDHLGRSAAERAEAFGYGSWTRIGENVAAGQQSPEQVLQSWLASPLHRQNILDPQFTDVGIGYAENLEGSLGHYWVQAFGAHK